MMDEIMRQEERILLKEPLNKSSAAEQRIFFPIHAEWKTGNTRSIPLFSILLSEEKSLAVSSCRFNQSFLRKSPFSGFFRRMGFLVYQGFREKVYQAEGSS